jgi:opacity protein-like surface antigen
MRSVLNVMVLLAALVALAPATASAQYVDRDNEVRFEEEFDNNEFLVAPRIRAIVVPDFLLGIWYDEHSSHWEDRANLAYGFEFVWRKVDAFEMSTAIEYADLSMPSSFWKESGDNPSEADFTEVDMKLLSMVFSGYWYWDVKEWFAPYVGGGVGAGVILGDIVRYDPVQGSSCEQGLGGADGYAPNECFNDDGQPDPNQIDQDSRQVEDGVPAVVPMINLSGGARFNIGKYGVAKLEVGFYDYFFAGASLGAQW